MTELLIAWTRGDEGALEKLMPHVESELHAAALRYMRKEARGHSLQATALVNEVYMRMAGWDPNGIVWQSRAHFFAIAAKIMRRILVDHARRKQRERQHMEALQLPPDSSDPGGRPADLIELDLALQRLAEFDKRKSQIVEIRFFGGLNETEAAEVLQLSVRTVQREWSLARAWLFRELGPEKSF